MIVEAQEEAQWEGMLWLISDAFHRCWLGREVACMPYICNHWKWQKIRNDPLGQTHSAQDAADERDVKMYFENIIDA